ncbi:nuclear transport factor 2 family protein [Mesorhizobium sp. CAU 1741]|uniref:nuclear transport factor 2 family protein n=1 Tax=Mesorhizobium sp. CAU 1741 TaxID=3140366 RepID=UPI00325B8A86
MDAKDDVVALALRVFRAIEARDVDAAVAIMAPDVDIFDPHYPVPRMSGQEEFRAGMEWGLSVMERFGFTVMQTFLSQDGFSAAFEVASHHKLKAGKELSFSQVFVVEARDGLIRRLHAYEPYGPNGIGGFFLGLERLKRRLTGRR